MSYAAEVYAHVKEVLGGRRVSRRRLEQLARADALETERDATKLPYGPGRDPNGLAAALDLYLESHDLKEPLAHAALLVGWEPLVGAEIAAHATPVHVEDRVLVVECDSTAWATQLRSLRGELVTTIARAHPEARVESIRFLNPGAPSWKRGPRSVPGRGPRDTYG